jgi:MOSC domain-containing protein YiiM
MDENAAHGTTQGQIVAVCLSKNKGERKKNIGRGKLLECHGLEGDSHTGEWHRQVSLLAMESIEKMRAKGLDVGPGDFAENITTSGLDLMRLPVGTLLRLGNAVGEVTQIGKECHTACAIRQQAGDCVMPREGIFVRVLKTGEVSVGDVIQIVPWGGEKDPIKI